MPAPKGRVAFVTGVNGISGNAIVEYMIRQPKSEWSRIVITSRSPLGNYWEDPRIEFVALDFLAPVKDIIAKITPTCSDVTHAYFTSYVHVDDFEKLKDYNAPLFENFLTAIDTVAGASLQRVCLQTGLKHYGCHLGPIAVPMREEHGRYDDKGLNFYYLQEDFMFALQKKRQWKWNVIRPGGIIGFTPAGNKFSYNVVENVSAAVSIADMTIWATTENHTADEAFNHENGDLFCFRDLFPKLGAYFGVEVLEPKFTSLGESSELIENEYHMIQWAKDKKPVWERICKKYGGDPEAFDWGTWQSMDWAVGKSWPAATTASKARKFGWTRFDDTYQNWLDTFRSFENARILPSLQ
ncbi:hypothetical protein FANTH_4412 [Fusarium anthophilum]|uniref:PRISE-like Rossmann-fold domain-containing protein n=1 Tax=Fusarium anthophilum TaxID=48485 RepID=A0A8H4ZPI7_9HYPO|nr:hypothetical protein FANTH_4412 [Fusarium anthophilum]